MMTTYVGTANLAKISLLIMELLFLNFIDALILSFDPLSITCKKHLLQLHRLFVKNVG